MTTQTQPTPATKKQVTDLIDLCLDANMPEAAGLLKLASELISEKVREIDSQNEIETKLDGMIADMAKAIVNIREVNEINTRMVEGASAILLKMQDNPDHPRSTDEIKAEYFEDYGADYKERNDLYHTAIGC